MRAWWAVLVVCVMAFVPGVAGAAALFNPGFKTLGVWVEDKDLRLDINVWYPSVRKPSDVSYAPWMLQVARNGREVEGRFPLLLLSHDSSGTRFSHHETAAYLARCGFVVAAPTHKSDNADNMPHLFTLRQLLDRVEQLRAALDVVLTHPDIQNSVDPNRVGVMGFGVGGTAALMLGGALPSAEGWAGYCTTATKGDPYCTSWAAPRMRQLVNELPLKKSPADTRIKAVAAVAPAYGMLFRKDGLRWLYPPLLIVKAGEDAINRAPLHADALRSAAPVTPVFDVIEGADATTLMSACPPALHKNIPGLCGSATPAQRRTAHKQLNGQLGNFFLRTLGDAQHLPQIPAPPDLTPPPPPQEVKEKPATPEKRKTRSRGARRSAPKDGE